MSAADALEEIATSDTHRVLAAAEANLAESRRLGFERLVLAREWALLHAVDPDDLPDPRCRPDGLGVTGTLVGEYAPAELGICLELHPLAARRLMGDAIDLHERHPHLWRALSRGELETWVARKIAAATAELSLERALWVDAAVGRLLATLPTGRLLAVVEARVVEADQDLADRKHAQAAATRGVWLGRENVHGIKAVHIRADAAAAARLYDTCDHLARLLDEHANPHDVSGSDVGPLSLPELRAHAAGLLANPLAALRLLLGLPDQDADAGPDPATGREHAAALQALADAVKGASPAQTRPRAMLYLHLTPDALRGRGVTRAEQLGALTRAQLVDLLGHHQVTLRPVIDLAHGTAADCYEIPASISEQLHLVRPADVFPYAESLSRSQDQDHTIPYDPHGPPGQTRLDNLGHLVRRHHRVKTHASGWTLRQHHGRYTWTTPHGRVLTTDHNGTHPVTSAGEIRVFQLLASHRGGT